MELGGGGADEGVAAEAAVWWGPKAVAAAAAAASASADVMNQLCRVCGEPAAGFHFGAFTCEGCKSFFGRTYSNLSSISECKNNGECVINKKNRTSCKACRLRKCLLVGMSKSGSRYGRRSNWFKIHCLLQERQQQQQLQQHQHVAAAAAGSAGASQCPSPVTVQRDAKSNSSPAWAAKAAGERDGSKNFHLEAKRLAAGSPPRVSAPQLPSQHLSLPGYPGDAAASAAAFWAQARGSLLQLPTPHLSGLPVPFLTPPFLHSTGFHPYQHKNFLLPFLPADSAAVRPPRQPSPAASCIHSPLLGCGRRSASSGGCSSDGVSPLPSPPAPPATAPPSVAALPLVPPSQPLPPPPVSTAAAAAAAALVVETLRSLGPMQERPLDLSVKGAGYGNPSRILNSKRSSESESECEDDQESEDDDQQADDEVFMAMAQDGKDAPGQSGVPEGAAMRRTTPLDLTTRA